MSSDLRVEGVSFQHPDAQLLVSEVQVAYTELYGAPDDTPLEDDGFEPPQGLFLVGYVDTVPVAMGGWRRRHDVHVLGAVAAAELKRMYVAPAARRRGHGRTVLAHLEDSAREAGADAMILETGSPQFDGIAMYTAAGYERVEAFGHYTWSPLVRCFGKRL